jgi:hypothetical protein
MTDRKRKLPDWMVAETQYEENDEHHSSENRVVENARIALAILESGLKHAHAQRQDDALQDPDDGREEEQEEPDAFDLSQSSVADVMTSADALEILGVDDYQFKHDRLQIIWDLRRALQAA